MSTVSDQALNKSDSKQDFIGHRGRSAAKIVFKEPCFKCFPVHPMMQEDRYQPEELPGW